MPNYLIICCIYGYNVNMEHTTKKTPYQLVISEFGGVRALGRAIQKDPTNISKWGKTHGCIPAKFQKKVLEKAWELGYELTPYNIIFGEE